MKRLIVSAIVSLGLSLSVKAQTTTYPVLISDTFTFSGYPTAQPGTVVSIISYDGTTPANPPNGPDAQFPYHMGSIELSSSGSTAGISGISVPFDLNDSRGYGYLNNGDLRPCDKATWGPQTWTVGNGTSIGDTYTVSASTTCPYFVGEYGTYQNSNNRLDGFNVTATYMLTSFAKRCPRGRPCFFVPDFTLQGGTGTITEWDITPPPSTP